MKFAFLAFLAFLANSIVSSESFAKPIKIIGSCRGAEGDQVSAEDCEVLAVDGFRTVKTGTAGKLRAGFVVYGFKPSGKPIEWRDDTEVFWVLCSVSTPVVMSYGEKGLIVEIGRAHV